MKPRANLIVEESDGELIVLDQDGEEVHQLNQTAALIWYGLSHELPMEEIAGTLTEAFDVKQEVALSDVRTTIDQLRELGLLED